MSDKTLPFTREQIERIAADYPTPFHIYDERAMRDNAKRLNAAFSWAPGFREFFAVKACPNPYIMKLLAGEGFGADCSSMAELELARRAGITGESVFFSSNDTPAAEYIRARELGAIINLDDISHIPFLEKHASLPEVISFRYNPGSLRGGNAIIGTPEEAKYGFTREQLFEGYRTVRERGVKRFGLHTMVASNELNPDYFVDTAEMLFSLVLDLHRELGIRFEFVNLGGGFGIPYRPEDRDVDMAYVAGKIRERYDALIRPAGLHPLGICMESGRMITGPYGYLVSRVLHLKDTYKKYVGLDACMANLMRPALYGAYHHITVPGKESLPRDRVYDVTGSLCENNDKFAIDRPLPEIGVGDLVVIHDAGAHGHAMGFNYNGKLRSAELLLREDGSVEMIRRAETLDDYFATIDFSRL
ncbi:MAG TPA: diaminopimelate decarboxylase [Spirochaetota bacterium]|nr:diaminopimelate decarboxylase [Spirochaetota bacterium]HOD15614.1 diaminopimelate decarboxylase [Spirochaetota bacterium]HPN14241.1 diaminopimelate decarboxylase [Spirochaetota bacterium]